MPFKSSKQRAFMFKNLPAIANRWARKYGGKVKETASNVGKVIGYLARGGKQGAKYQAKEDIKMSDAAIRQIKEQKRMFPKKKAEIPEWYKKAYKRK